MPNNNLPLFAEEQKQLFNEEQKIEQIQEILSQFQQPIPSGFIPLQVEHICSTKPKWEGKPLSERYSFTHGEKWIWIDIPHTLMETLGLEKGEEITQPLYLDPQVLTRPKTYKGIDIKDGEIFIQNYFTIQNLEKDINKLFDLIKELKREKEEKQGAIEDLKREKQEIEKDKKFWENESLEERRKNKALVTERNYIQQELTELRTKLNVLTKSFQEAQAINQQVYDILGRYSQQKEPLLRSQEVVQKLQKELSWWDMWINDSSRGSFGIGYGFHSNYNVTIYCRDKFKEEIIGFYINESDKGMLKFFKRAIKEQFYQYYKNK